MAIAALSPNSVLASPIQANPQIRTDLQTSVPQVAQDAQKSVKSAQTDTITISRQALKLADDKSAAAKESAAKDSTTKADEQRASQAASDKSYSDGAAVQKDALKAYAAVSAGR